MISDFKDACELNNDDWNELVGGWIKKYLDEKGLPVLVPRMELEIVEKQKALDQAKAMLNIQGNARLKALKSYVLEELVRIRKINRDGVVRDWRVKELEIIIKEAMKRFRVQLADVAKILKERSEKFDELEQEKVEEALDTVAEELVTGNKMEGLSERDLLVLQASSGGLK